MHGLIQPLPRAPSLCGNVCSEEYFFKHQDDQTPIMAFFFLHMYISTSVLLTDIANERHQQRERWLALIALSSLVGWSVKMMTCLALIMTFSKSIPPLNISLMQTEICCGLCHFSLLQHHLNGSGILRSEDWSPAGKSLVVIWCSAAQKLFQWGRIHTISGEIKQTDKGHTKKEVFILA